MARNLSIVGAVLAIGACCCGSGWAAEVAGWDPSAFASELELQFLTVGSEEGEHWSTVWLVLIDGDLYVRLGNRATGRVRENTTAPYVAVKIAGKKFDRVRLVEAAEMKERVNAAMKEKYTSDFIFRRFEHPLTMRLQPEGPEP